PKMTRSESLNWSFGRPRKSGARYKQFLDTSAFHGNAEVSADAIPGRKPLSTFPGIALAAGLDTLCLTQWVVLHLQMQLVASPWMGLGNGFIQFHAETGFGGRYYKSVLPD